MAEGDRAARLGAYQNEPTVQRAVLACLDKAERPLRLAEIAERCGLRTCHAGRALNRLDTMGAVTRHKLPMTYRHVSKRGKVSAVTYRVWFYTAVGE